MGNNDQKINRSMMIGWVIIVVILVCAYFGEYLKGTRSGSYMVVFSLITVLPLLTLIVLYHQPNLVLIMGVLSLIANLAYDAKLFWEGNITLENSRDVEIQLALRMGQKTRRSPLFPLCGVALCNIKGLVRWKNQPFMACIHLRKIIEKEQETDRIGYRGEKL